MKTTKSSKKPICCKGDHILSCIEIDLDFSVLRDDSIYLEPLNTSLIFLGMIGESTTAYSYGNKDLDFTISYEVGTDGAYGHAALIDARSFIVEYCGGIQHVLKELDVNNLGDDISLDFEDKDSKTLDRSLVVKALDDTTTIVTYSIKIYYTPQFKAKTPNIKRFINEALEETNQGYINSQVPLRVKLLCTEEAKIDDNYNSSKMLRAFTAMKGTPEELRGTADAAALLVFTLKDCGIAWNYNLKTPFSVTSKNCAIGYYSFGHELGHNFGLDHNREQGVNRLYDYGYGHLIDIGSSLDQTGFRTIMAYNAPGHYNRKNFYSNPNVIFNETGTPTGVFGKSNNARVLIENRFAFADIGDESLTCSTGTPTQAPTIKPTQASTIKPTQDTTLQTTQSSKTSQAQTSKTTVNTPTTTTTSVSCVVKNSLLNKRWRKIKNRRGWEEKECRDQCFKSRNCLSWVWIQDWAYLGFCYLNTFKIVRSNKYSFGPNLTKKNCIIDKTCQRSRTGISYNRKYLGKAFVLYASDCQSKCKETQSCTEWVYDHSKKACSFYSPGYFFSLDLISGNRFCVGP